MERSKRSAGSVVNNGESASNQNRAKRGEGPELLFSEK